MHVIYIYIYNFRTYILVLNDFLLLKFQAKYIKINNDNCVILAVPDSQVTQTTHAYKFYQGSELMTNEIALRLPDMDCATFVYHNHFIQIQGVYDVYGMTFK